MSDDARRSGGGSAAEDVFGQANGLGDGLQIRAMTAADLPGVLRIERASFDDPWPEEVFRAELRHCWSHCRVLEKRPSGPVDAARKSGAQDEVSGGGGAGTVLLGYVVFWSVGDEVHLLNVAVDPAKRHLHHGRLLIEHLRGHAQEAAARFITLEVRRSNEAAIAMYEGTGFKRVGVRPGYFGDNGEDAIVMLYDMGSTSEVGPLPSA